MKTTTQATLGILALLAVCQFSHAEREAGGLRAPLAIEVNFSSPGNGIDVELQDKVLEVANDEIRSGKLSALTVKPWGREGERRLCLQFADWQRVRTVAKDIKALVDAANAQARIKKTTLNLRLDCFGSQPQPNE